MKTALILAVVVAAYCLTACGGSDDEDCDAPPAAEQGMDKAPTEPCRAAAQ
ncbi:MAG: hypothetical protein ABL916_23965 [Burkholderiaceae bacterium]